MIDWARVDALRSEVGDEDFAEIASLFLSELEDTVALLKDLTGDTALSEAFHGLKGSALNLGFADLAGLCAAAEKSPDPAAIAPVAACCTASVAELRTRFPDL